MSKKERQESKSNILNFIITSSLKTSIGLLD